MSKITSKDGTSIAFEKLGNGPAVILVDGALCYRRLGPMAAIARELASGFTVFTYDRRGRGESGDTAPYSVQREVDDVEALIDVAGGSAFIYGASSGAALALAAASRLEGVRKLALYEAPFIVDGSHAPQAEDYPSKMNGFIAADQRGNAVRLFMKAVGVPAIVVAMMPLMPQWSKLKAAAHTLPYDAAIMGDTRSGKPLPTERWAAVTMPALVGIGGKSPLSMRNAMRALANVLPNAQLRVLDRETHIVKTKAIAPLLAEFFSSHEVIAEEARGDTFQYRGDQCH
jgi:pimeloyl-ACP methyl ester carboxylesterase